jgi:hypothetical protein
MNSVGTKNNGGLLWKRRLSFESHEKQYLDQVNRLIIEQPIETVHCVLNFLSLGLRGWSSMYYFDFRRWSASNVEIFPMFRHTLQLPSSGWMWRWQLQSCPPLFLRVISEEERHPMKWKAAPSLPWNRYVAIATSYDRRCTTSYPTSRLSARTIADLRLYVAILF